MTSYTHTFSSALIALPIYFLITACIGWFANRGTKDANSYLNATHSLPLWIVTAAYLAANCGALEIIGLGAAAAQYGVQAFHFYWIGAIPAMIFLAIWMMPIYRRSQAKTIPEYLEKRYSPGVRLLNAIVVACTMLLLGGISLYAIAQVMQVVLALNFGVSVVLSAAVVLIYVLLGGVRATIYNEVFQLLIMLIGLIPLAVKSFLILRTLPPLPSSTRTHLWTSLPFTSSTSSMDTVGVIWGLGFVLSFGYWCTDFVLMQRTFTARTEVAARQVPLWAGLGKLGFACIVVLPGLVAYRMFPELSGSKRFDQALPLLMQSLYGPFLLGVGLTALVASLMSGLAANVSGFTTLWTEDIYRARIRKFATDEHYIWVARLATTAAILISCATSYINFLFSDLMEHVQLIFAIFGAPFWAVFLLGMCTRRVHAKSAIAAIASGVLFGFVHLFAVIHGWIHYGSLMNANFHGAIDCFLFSVVVALCIPSCKKQTSISTMMMRWTPFGSKKELTLLCGLSTLVAALCLLLNWIWK